MSFRMEISDGPGPAEVMMTSMTDQKVTAMRPRRGNGVHDFYSYRLSQGHSMGRMRLSALLLMMMVTGVTV